MGNRTYLSCPLRKHLRRGRVVALLPARAQVKQYVVRVNGQRRDLRANTFFFQITGLRGLRVCP